MSARTATLRGHPTPPTGEADLSFGLDLVAQHNAGVPEGVHGLGISYDDGYDHHDPSFYQQEAYSHTSAPQAYQGHRAPPTPRSNTASDGGRQTRSGRIIKRTNSPHSSIAGTESRVSSSPRPKRAKAGKKKNGPAIEGPLSELTANSTVPLKDMEAWVNRSAEVRQKEAAERKGYITRPMNSFMLYRSAYAERTKEFCLQNNHQVVSSVAGESWPMEPQSVRDFYNDLAKTERTNHQKAHPTYKFSPSKSTAASRKRNHEDDDDAVSDDDPDGDYAPSRRAAKQPRRQEMEQTYYVQNPYAEQPYYTQGQGVHQQAGWDAYGKPPPTPYGVDQHGQYYAHQHYQQSPVQQRQQLLAQQQAYYQQQLEQQHLRMNQAQAAPFAGQSLVSLPGSQHHELHARTQTPNQFQQQYYQAQDEFQYPEGFDPSYGLQAARTSHFDTAFLGIGANDSAWALDPALGTGLETETEYGKYLENE